MTKCAIFLNRVRAHIAVERAAGRRVVDQLDGATEHARRGRRFFYHRPHIRFTPLLEGNGDQNV